MGEMLPPIAVLRAFSRAAETLSFKEAAADLHLSPSAVSRQIHSLEAHLGVALFLRLNPGLEITDAGRRYLETANRVLAELRRAQEGFAVHPSDRFVSARSSRSPRAGWSLTWRTSSVPIPGSICRSKRRSATPTSRATRSTSRSASVSVHGKTCTANRSST
jgi:predicted transcriptional regulator